MSDVLPPRFLPWLWTGLATQIATVAELGLATTDTAEATVSVQVRASGPGGEVVQAVPGPGVRVRGPGEIVGIDASQVVRTDPEPGAVDAEPVYFALIELAAPDFPWRFTPAAPDAESRLQPWIALAVVEEREGVWLEDRGASPPVLHVDDPSVELPDLTQCWAWAHVHVEHELASGVAVALAAEPEAFRSRLLCPRRLPAGRSWIACVVPTFAAGVVAAGLPDPPGAGLLAWEPGATAPVQLPVYHSWRFSTGEAGDFESLVRRLQARELEGSVGRRDLDIGDPGGGLPKAPGTKITYEGALLSPSGRPSLWRADHRAAMKSALRKSLNRQARRGTTPAPYSALAHDPIVGPPAYAAPQAGRRLVPADNEPPVWFEELNTEPHRRAVAGLGAEVVRNDQESLMAAAWEHAAGLREVNRTLVTARLAWELGRKAQPRFASLSDEKLVQIARPAMARLVHPSGTTVRGALVESALPRGLVSGTFRRLASTVRGFAMTTTGKDGRPVAVRATDAVTVAAIDDPVGFVARWGDAHPPLGAETERELPEEVDDAVEGPSLQAVARNPERVTAARTALAARRRRSRTTSPPVATLYDFPRPDLDLDDVIHYDGDADAVSSLAAAARTALDPMATVVKMIEGRVVGLPVERDHEVPNRLSARPQFTTPMYERLRALSVEYLVPGIGDVPDNTLGLLEVNQEFVEAFLGGLNHELGREFVWREYPARLSATWAQQFWDTGPGGPLDITPIAHWDEATALGTHAPGSAASLVLLIKGALPRRYPDVRIYAVEAAWSDGQRREKVGGRVSMPVFAGRLGRDAFFYGFDLTEEEARGSTVEPQDPDDPGNPGWFFVLEEQPRATRFGLDAPRAELRAKAPKNWTSLSWAHLVDVDDPLPGFVDTAGPTWVVGAGALPGNGPTGERDRWGADAAAMARITFQRPVRMLAHADSMLPPGGS